jgi:hypothetical protein
MLQKREEEANSKDGNAEKNTGLNTEDRINHAEKSLRELKKNTASGKEAVDSYKHSNAKLKEKEPGGFFHRLRGPR